MTMLRSIWQSFVFQKIPSMMALGMTRQKNSRPMKVRNRVHRNTASQTNFGYPAGEGSRQEIGRIFDEIFGAAAFKSIAVQNKRLQPEQRGAVETAVPMKYAPPGPASAPAKWRRPH